MDYSPPGSSVQGIVPARILEWVAISPSRGSSWPRDQTYNSCVSRSGRQNLYYWVTWEADNGMLLSRKKEQIWVSWTKIDVIVSWFYLLWIPNLSSSCQNPGLLLLLNPFYKRGFRGSPVVKNPPCNARDTDLILASGRSHMSQNS